MAVNLAKIKLLLAGIKPLEYFIPTSNQGNNFWSTPVAQGLGNTQRTLQNVGQVAKQAVQTYKQSPIGQTNVIGVGKINYQPLKPAVTQIGQKLQQFPDTTIDYQPKVNLIGLNNGYSPVNLSKFATSLPGSMIQGYGDTAVKVGQGQRLNLWDALNVSDFVPGIGFIGMGGIKNIAKEGLEKAGREGVEKAGKIAIEDIVEPAFRTGAKTEQKIRNVKEMAGNLLNETPAQTAFRRELGLSPKEVYQNIDLVKDEYMKFGRVAPSNVINDARVLKDITPTQKGLTDVYRNFETVFKADYPRIKKLVLDPFDDAKKTYVQMYEYYAKQLDKNVISLGIKKGSRESAIVQLFGEGKMSFDEVVKELGQTKATNISKADNYFRKAYDELLDTVNNTRRQLYPNNPEMLIPKRQDYYRHFQDLSGVEGLKNIFDTPAGIDPNLVGVSDFTTPKGKWLSFAQKRRGDVSKEDAVGGFLDYLQKASYNTNIDPAILRFRKLESELIKKTGANSEVYKGLNNFIEFLEDFTNDLAGKTNPIDRVFQKYLPGGRKTFKVLTWINSRVKANVVLGNLSNLLVQAGNLPQGVASAGIKNTITGAFDTVLSPIKKGGIIGESGFITERYLDTFRFDTGILNNAKKGAIWLTQIADEFSTKTIWNGHYRKALSESIENPIRYADGITRKLVSGRGVGEVPLIQKAKMTQLVAPFMLEVQNLWHIIGGNITNREFGKLAKLLVYNYLFNSLTEQVIGRRVVFDPINAVADAIGAYNGEEDKTKGALMAGGRLGGEVLSNTIGGSTVAGLYPEYGISGTGLPTRKQLFGQGDPTRFGTGLVASQALTDPLFKLLPPFGGNQLKKTIQGVQAVKQGYNATPKGQVRFPITQSPVNALQYGAFGQYAGKEARQYFDSGAKPLSEKQSQAFLKAQGKSTPKFEVTGDMPKTIADKLELAIKGIYLDPTNTIKALFTVEELRKIEGNAVILKRQEFLNKSRNPNYRLDHVLPLGLGGDNTPSNQKLVTKEYHEAKTKNDNALIRQLQAGTISKQEAQRQVKSWLANHPTTTYISQEADTTTSADTYSQIMAKREQDGLVDKTKEFVKQTGQSGYVGDTFLFFDQATSEVKSLDTSFMPDKIELTGNTELDKSLLSKFNTQVSKRKGIVLDMYEQGLITGDEAEKQLADLKQFKASIASGGSSTKKVTAKKISLPRISMAKVKLPTIKIKAPPKPKAIKIGKNKLTVKNITYKLKQPKNTKLQVTKANRLPTGVYMPPPRLTGVLGRYTKPQA